MLVAVYGTLKKTYGNHVLLEKSKFVGHASYSGLMFHMGFFPGVVLTEDVHMDHPCHKFIKTYSFACELYEVDDSTLLALDRLEGHPKFYYRTPMLDPKYGEVHIYTQRAAKQLVGVKQCIPGGYWYGSHTSVMEVNFFDGVEKPKILAWRGGMSPKSSPTIIIPPTNKEEVIVPPPNQAHKLSQQHHNSHYYEGEWDDDEHAEIVIDLRNQETEIDLTVLDQVKEA